MKYPYEIIQIGAVKLDGDYRTIGTFNRYIKPTIYSQISTFVTELTGITTEQLAYEATFPVVFQDYMEFIGDQTAVFCTWGMSDIKELFRNVEYHKLEKDRIPVMYINLQPYVSLLFNMPKDKLLKLQFAVETLNIPIAQPFHDALHDAVYTAEIFRKIMSSAITPKHYSPNQVIVQPRQRKKVIDFESLLRQFEKMYARELSEGEKDIILLAYKMGKTGQFMKEI